MDKERKSKQRERKERKDQGMESRIKQLQHKYLQVTFFMCDFLDGLDMHDFACWCMALLLSVAWFCRVMIVVFNLVFPFS